VATIAASSTIRIAPFGSPVPSRSTPASSAVTLVVAMPVSACS